jgi:hypothetical protein
MSSVKSASGEEKPAKRAKATKAADQSQPVRGKGRPYSIAGLFVLLGVSLGGLCWLGLWGLDQRVRTDLDKAGNYQFSFDQIEVASPRGMGRQAFLAEVRFLAGGSDSLSLLDRDLPARLSASFRGHPWVAEVRSVSVLPGSGIRVDLKFRDPVLRVADPVGKTERLVDPAAILLPRVDGAREWPMLEAEPERGPAAPGQPWPSKVVAEGARLAGVLASGSLSGKVRALKRMGIDWIISTPQGDIRWGRSPGMETAGEPSPADKIAVFSAWLASPSRETPDLTVPRR